MYQASPCQNESEKTRLRLSRDSCDFGNRGWKCLPYIGLVICYFILPDAVIGNEKSRVFSSYFRASPYLGSTSNTPNTSDPNLTPPPPPQQDNYQQELTLEDANHPMSATWLLLSDSVTLQLPPTEQFPRL